jgi:anti-sigma B factor antagonist
MGDWDVVFNRSELDGRPVLSVSGEIDLAIAGRFAEELESLVGANGSSAVVDLSAVEFIDSSGIRELLKAKSTAETAGGDLVLLSPSPACRRVLEISGVWSNFTVLEASS